MMGDLRILLPDESTFIRERRRDKCSCFDITEWASSLELINDAVRHVQQHEGQPSAIHYLAAYWNAPPQS